MFMGRTKKVVGLALDPKLLELVERWRDTQDVKPSKTAVHEAALREFFERRNFPPKGRAK